MSPTSESICHRGVPTSMPVQALLAALARWQLTEAACTGLRRSCLLLLLLLLRVQLSCSWICLASGSSAPAVICRLDAVLNSCQVVPATRACVQVETKCHEDRMHLCCAL